MLNIRRYLIPLLQFARYRTGLTMPEAVARCARRGFGVEFCVEFGGVELFAPANIELMRPLVAGLDHTYHCDMKVDRNPAAFFPVIEAAAALGTHCLVIHPQPLGVQRFDKAGQNKLPVDYVAAAELIARGRERGVQFVLENNIQPNALGDLESALEKIPGLKICLDICHAFCSAMRYPGCDAGIPRFITRLKDHIYHLHLDWTRLSFGRVNLPIDHVQLVIGLLRDAGYDGFATLEEQPPDLVQVKLEDRAFFNELVNWVGDRPLAELDSDFFAHEYQREAGKRSTM